MTVAKKSKDESRANLTENCQTDACVRPSSEGALLAPIALNAGQYYF